MNSQLTPTTRHTTQVSPSQPMKILVIGCGSIGQRHIRNLIALQAGEIFAFDINAKKLKEVNAISSTIQVSNNLSELWEKNPELVFITLPTSLHIKYAIEAVKRDCHLFIEKPLSINLKRIPLLLDIVKKKKIITLVGCNMRFYWAIAKIKELLSQKIIGKIISARVECGEYLPDWHPKDDYRKLYSARRDLGGGVLLDAIHEIDYATWFFGEVEEIRAMYGKLSSLDIETEDTAEIMLKFKKGPLVSVHMDYIQRIYGRGCKIVGEEGTISWVFHEHTLKLFQAKNKKWKEFSEPKNYNLNQMYFDEIKYFLNCVEKRNHTFNDVFTASNTLQVTLKAKRGGVLLEV